MNKLTIGFFFAAVVALIAWDWHWATQGVSGMDPAARLNHLFNVAAYTIAWAIQFGYLAWLGFKWRSLKQAAARASRSPR